MADWFADGVSLLALGVSGATYLTGRPRLKVTAGPPTMLVGIAPDRHGPRIGTIVTVVNDGGKAVLINTVHLGANGVVGKLISAPQPNVVLEAGGDRRSWIFDSRDLHQQLAEQVRTQLRDPNAPLRMRATVHTGSKTKQSGIIQVNPPGGTTPRPLARRELWQQRYRSWFRPTAFILTFAPTAEELGLRTHRVMVNNTGRGVLPASELVLTVSHSDASRGLVQGYQPVSLPRISGRQSKVVEVSLVDDSQASPGDTYHWVLRLRGFLHWGQPAVACLISQIPELRARLSGQATPPGGQPG